MKPKIKKIPFYAYSKAPWMIKFKTGFYMNFKFVRTWQDAIDFVDYYYRHKYIGI